MADKLLGAKLATEVNPIYYKGDLTVCGNDWRYENIKIGYDKFYFIIDGECIIEIDDIKHTAKKGQLFWLTGNSKQTLYTENGQTVKKYWFHCTLPCKESSFSELFKLPLFINVKDPALVEGMFQSIIANENEPSLNSKLEQKADILKLISYYIKSSDKTSVDLNYDNRIAYVISYIENNLSKNLTIEELSDILHFHPSYFIRFFRAATGVTPLTFIQQKRISLAQRLLLDKNMSIQDISATAGFSNPHYFSHYFKKATGLTPSEYRSIAIK